MKRQFLTIVNPADVLRRMSFRLPAVPEPAPIIRNTVLTHLPPCDPASDECGEPAAAEYVPVDTNTTPAVYDLHLRLREMCVHNQRLIGA